MFRGERPVGWQCRRCGRTFGSAWKLLQLPADSLRMRLMAEDEARSPLGELCAGPRTGAGDEYPPIAGIPACLAAGDRTTA